MRVGLFSDTYYPEINGVATSTHILRNALEANGHEVFVITTKGKNDPVDDHVLRFNGIELKSLYGYIATGPLHLWALNRVRNMKLDIIHAQTEFGIGIFARLVAKTFKIPLVSTYHTTYEDYTHYANPFNSKSIDKAEKKLVAKLSKLYGDSSIRVISPSPKTKEMLEKYGIKREIDVIPTGLDLNKFKKENVPASKVKEIRDTYHISDDEMLITYVGRVAEEKSIDVVINCFKEFNKTNDKVKLLIVGGGPDLDSLKKMVTNYGLDKSVFFAGKRPSETMPYYYCAADAFISASLTETQGMTFIEALASSTMILARYDSVLDDILIEGKTGYFFSNPIDFGEKINKYLALSKEAKQQMSEDCLKQVEPYDSEVFYSRVMKVYEQAIKSYKKLYVIDQIKAKDAYVQLSISTPEDETVKVLVSLDEYFEKGYRKQTSLSKDEYDKLIEDELSVKAYQACIRKISVKDRTRKEMYDYLCNNTKLDIAKINDIIDKLEDIGYIDDMRYTKTQVENMRLSLAGENKIVRYLKKKGINPDMISQVLDNTDKNDELSHAQKWAEKAKETIKEKSLKMKKRMLREKLAIQGFNSHIIDEVMSQMNFVEDEKEEIDNLKHVANKAKRRYQRKYSGSALRNNVYRYCASMGFENADIYAVLDEMEWADDKED